MNDTEPDGMASPSSPTSAGRESGSRALGPVDPKLVTAHHEAGHSCASFRLTNAPPQLLSIRPTERYAGVTKFGADPRGPRPELDVSPGLSTVLQPLALREAIERDVIILWAGPVAGMFAGISAARYGIDGCEEVAERQAVALAELVAPAREALGELEAETSCLQRDTDALLGKAKALTDDDDAALAFAIWLKAEATRLVKADSRLISAVAAKLYADGVMDAAGFLELASPSPKVEETPQVFKPTPKPKPTPTIGDGIPLFIPEPLTLQNPHARIATRGFFGRGRLIAEGSLADERSPLVKFNSDKYRKPTEEERSGEAAAEARRIAINVAEMAARKADTAVKAAEAKARIADAALAAVKS